MQVQNVFNGQVRDHYKIIIRHELQTSHISIFIMLSETGQLWNVDTPQ